MDWASFLMEESFRCCINCIKGVWTILYKLYNCPRFELVAYSPCIDKMLQTMRGLLVDVRTTSSLPWGQNQPGVCELLRCGSKSRVNDHSKCSKLAEIQGIFRVSLYTIRALTHIKTTVDGHRKYRVLFEFPSTGALIRVRGPEFVGRGSPLVETN